MVEILVVMLIMGVIAAIAVPIYINQRNVAYQTSVKVDVSNTLLALDDQKLDGKYSTTLPQDTTLSSGVTVRVRTSVDRKSTCVDGYHKSAPTKVWKISSSTKKVSAGACS